MGKKRIAKKVAIDFHKELNELLKKYDFAPEDGNFDFVTSKLHFSVNNPLNCKPECQMTKIVTLPNGQTRIITFCDPNCH